MSEMKRIGRARLSIDVNEKQEQFLREFIPWGVKNKVFSVIIDDLMKAVQKHGSNVIGALVSRHITTMNFVKELDGEKDGNDR